MKKDLVVKTNRLNQAFQVLSLAELHIVQLAIVDARETGTGLSTDTPLRIEAKRYAEVFDTSRQNAYQRMKEAEDTLFNRRFSFYDHEGVLVKSRWISQVRYLDDQGAIEIVFTPAVVQGISRINGVKEFFTQYLLSQTAQLKSVYSARLYELLIQWRSTGRVPMIDLSTFREQLGIGINEYQRMHHLKARVLDLAIQEINEKTDITVQYDQHKEGRLIKGFSFSFKQKEEAQPKKAKEKTIKAKDENTIDLFSAMTEKQLNFFSAKLADLPAVQAMAEPGEEMIDFAGRIKGMLQDPMKQKKLQPYLKQVGFSSY